MIKQNPKLLALAFGGCVLGVVAAVVFLGQSDSTAVKPITEGGVLSVQDPSPLPESVADLDQLNFLLLGQGGPGHEGGELTDAIILVYMDFKQAKIF